MFIDNVNWEIRHRLASVKIRGIADFFSNLWFCNEVGRLLSKVLWFTNQISSEQGNSEAFEKGKKSTLVLSPALTRHAMQLKND